MKLPQTKEIVKLMDSRSYQPMTVSELARRLGVPRDSRKGLKKLLKRLVREESIKRIQGGRYTLGEYGAAAAKPLKEREAPKPILKPARPLAEAGKMLGTFIRTGKTGVIVPRNSKMPPIPVQLSEVKGVRSQSLVVAELSQTQSSRPRPSAHVVEVLGKAGGLEVEKKGLFVEFSLPDAFAPEAVRESDSISDTISPEVLAQRADLRGSLIVTIDNDTARDFDDAVGIERVGAGYRLTVSIADVSHYVKPGSEIDNEALRRATSTYLPMQVVPMLPERLSDWICSLVPNEDRATKTVEMEFDALGAMTSYRIYASVIRSRHRLTYSQVSALFEKKRILKKDRELVESLRVMKELYEKIRGRRIERGGLDFDIPEPQLVRDERGRTVDVVKAERNVAMGIIEEFMISANNAAASFTLSAKVPSIYRIHETPDFASIKELSLDLKRLGIYLNIERSVKPEDIQKVFFQSKGTALELAVNTMILRSLKRAIYSTETKGHFGLALNNYTHFTSPIRRYPDLIVHRIVTSLVDGRNSPYDEQSLDWMANHCSVKERFSAEVEREAVKLERVYMMKTHVGEDFDGLVISALQFGIFVELKDIFVEGFVPREKIKRGKRFEIGDEVRVRVIEADVERRRITLELGA
ncbi:MAG: ribonuclease R family protein [Deltaproteobacteria bacterium]